MKLRAPAVPLITVDPYFSVWSPADKLTDFPTVHWTGKSNALLGLVTVDGEVLRFMGVDSHKAIEQTDLQIDALTTVYTFETETVAVKAEFTAPMLPTDLDLLSRPVNYLHLSYQPKDGKKHEVSFAVSASEELCLDKAGQSPVVCSEVALENGKCMKMGNAEQKVLNRSGDDVRIDWGYFYLAVKQGTVASEQVEYFRERPIRRKYWFAGDAEKVTLTSLTAKAEGEALILFGYDDIQSIEYFGQRLSSWWNRDGMTVEMALEKAMAGYTRLYKLSKEFSEKLYADAKKAGGEEYAEILSLAYRQVMAAHKLAADENGELLFISKECFSNGCAATVDVSYPSIPMFIHYNPELVKGMMRPVFRYAASDAWKFDFAPHDVGQYPLLNGQVYGLNRETGELRYEMQMPVEESGNMLIMATAVAIAQKNVSFIKDHIDTLEDWAKYLIQYGQDPENQLCTDDFAGHLAHNCNLSLKAIMGLAGLSILFKMMNCKRKSADYMKEAKKMAGIWMETAKNGDGSFRLAFDRPNSFSMKYNAVWDKLFGTEIFPAEVFQSEVQSNFGKFNPYGMPLDNRSVYTKSDWTVWTATMLSSEKDFEKYIHPLWMTYHYSPSRVPLTDWYDTVTSEMVGFRHRTVQGGLFIKLMEKDFSKKCDEILKK